MFNFKTKPYAHQLTALEKSCDAKNYGYFMEMGCGKSKVLLDNIAYLASQGKIDTAVIVAPKGVYRNWETSGYRPTFLMKYKQKSMYGILRRIKHRRRNLGKGLRSVVSFAYSWRTWKASHLRSSPSLSTYLQEVLITYWLSTSPLRSKTPRPSALRRWSPSGQKLNTNGF